MKRSSVRISEPPPSKRRKEQLEVEGDSDSSEMEEDNPVEAEKSQYFSPSQLLSQEEKYAVAKTDAVLSEAEVGVIDKMTLINFMCHKRLDISLSPNVNFVLGRNGSGKSAIMTGIVVGLGGNARNTERGRSLKQFIRSGERSAEIRVSLRNRGNDAYRPEYYQNTIVVERVINNDGTGSYKIKSAKGKVISTKKEELVNILDHCNVQVDNPVSLLNQDTSRHFLQRSNAGDKYKLFMKATHLEQIASDYEKAEQDQEIMKDAIKRQKAMLPDLESDAKELEEKVDTFKRLTDMEDKVDHLKEELQWAMVAEVERGIAPIEKDVAKEKARIPRNAKKMEDTKVDVEKWSVEEKKVQERLSRAVKEASALQKERDEAVNEKRAIDRSLRDLSSKSNSLLGRIRDKEREKKCLEATRDECIAMSQRDVAGEKELRERQLQELQKKLSRLEGEIATAENDRKQFDADAKRAEGQQNQLRRQVGVEQESCQKCEDRLRQLRSSHNDSMAMFGQNIKFVVEAIARSKRQFTHLPIGPLGSKIKLRDYNWATAVEQVLKRSLLCGFVVDNHRDADALRKIIRNVYEQNRGRHAGGKPEVIVSQFQSSVYNVGRNRPRCTHPTVFDVLDVADPNVMNALIDQASVESILLIRTREEASKVIVHERPQGAKAAYTAEGDQVLQYAHYSNRAGKLGILRESVESAIRDEEARLAGLRQGLDELRRQEGECRQKMEGSKRHMQGAMRKVKDKIAEKRKICAAMEELRNAQEEEEPEEDIATYDSEIAEAEGVIAELRAEHNKLKEEHNRLKADRLECFQKCDRVEKEVDQMSSQMVALKNEMGDFSHKKCEAQKRVKFFEERIATIQSSVVELERKVEAQKAQVEVAIRRAEEVCPRIDTDRSRQSIRSEIEKLKRQIEQERPEQEEQVRIEMAYVDAMERFKKTKQAIANEDAALKKLKESLVFRKAKYENLIDRITYRTKLYFTHFLKQRDYSGQMIFNHGTEKLELNVQVDCHTDQSKATKNTKALSGGERSFTTVCFIMALWDAIEAPFRCLDEFDVFMDMMNRRISMRLMLEQAEDQPNRQFVFFTPQDMSSMGIKWENSKVKILKLNPPERGQTVLNAREN